MPFTRIDEEGETLLTASTAIHASRLAGIDHMSLTDTRARAARGGRMMAWTILGTYADEGVSNRMMTFRRLVRTTPTDLGKGAGLSGTARSVIEAWDTALGERLYQNEHYLVAWCNRGADAAETLAAVDAVVKRQLGSGTPAFTAATP